MRVIIQQITHVAASCLLSFCGLDPVLAARVGHTIGNGGGGAELRFRDIWNSAEYRLNWAALQSNPLNLSDSEIMAARLARMHLESCGSRLQIELEGPKTATSCRRGEFRIHQSELYSANAEPISEVQMWGKILQTLVKDCASNLVGSPTLDGLASRLAQLERIHRLDTSDSLLVGMREPEGGLQLTFISKALRTELNMVVREKLQVAKDATFQIKNYQVNRAPDAVELNVVVRLVHARDIHVLVFASRFSEKPEFQVFALDNPNGLP